MWLINVSGEDEEAPRVGAQRTGDSFRGGRSQRHQSQQEDDCQTGGKSAGTGGPLRRRGSSSRRRPEEPEVEH